MGGTQKKLTLPTFSGVGARSAACPPLSTTASMARSATIVLPEPTSPCSKRCMGCPAAKSSSIYLATANWPPVNWKGSDSSKASSRPPVRIGRAVAISARAAARRLTSNNCSKNASSKVKRSRAKSAKSK